MTTEWLYILKTEAADSDTQFILLKPTLTVKIFPEEKI